MSAAAGSGPFQCGWNAKSTTGFHECPAVLTPAFLVKIDGKEKTRLVLKHGINACNEPFTGVITARKMPTDYFVCHWKKLPILTLRALNSRLFADAANPFIAAGRRVT